MLWETSWGTRKSTIYSSFKWSLISRTSTATGSFGRDPFSNSSTASKETRPGFQWNSNGNKSSRSTSSKPVSGATAATWKTTRSTMPETSSTGETARDRSQRTRQNRSGGSSWSGSSRALRAWPSRCSTRSPFSRATLNTMCMTCLCRPSMLKSSSVLSTESTRFQRWWWSCFQRRRDGSSWALLTSHISWVIFKIARRILRNKWNLLLMTPRTMCTSAWKTWQLLTTRKRLRVKVYHWLIL